jgi:hypothetical protein
MVLVRILMSKSGFKDKVLIKLIVGVVKHVTIDEHNNNNQFKKKSFYIAIWLYHTKTTILCHQMIYILLGASEIYPFI